MSWWWCNGTKGHLNTFRIFAHVFLKRDQNTAQQATFLKFFLRSYLMALSYEKTSQTKQVRKKQCKKKHKYITLSNIDISTCYNKSRLEMGFWLSKQHGRFFQIFVAFSQYLNFKDCFFSEHDCFYKNSEATFKWSIKL